VGGRVWELLDEWDVDKPEDKRSNDETIRDPTEIESRSLRGLLHFQAAFEHTLNPREGAGGQSHHEHGSTGVTSGVDHATKKFHGAEAVVFSNIPTKFWD
jgi:hypothetical protein